jgi:hypothetical protein
MSKSAERRPALNLVKIAKVLNQPVNSSSKELARQRRAHIAGEPAGAGERR